MKIKISYAALFIFSLFCFSVPLTAFGSGFAIYTQGASALGQADSVIAHSESPSAIFFNPALISKLEGTQAEIGTTLIYPIRKFDSNAPGGDAETKSQVFFPSTLYFTHEYNEKVSVGLGVFNNFGLATKWDDDWEGRYIATNSELTVFTINPVVSVKLTDNISVGAGLDFLILNATLEKKLNLGGADANQKFNGDGNGVGFNLGILVDVSKDISIGASYRSEIEVDIDGSVSHRLPAGFEFLSPLFPHTSAETDLTLPSQFHLGVAYKGIRNLTLETGLRYEGWSSYEKLKLDLERPVFFATTSVAEKKWKDTYTFNIGADYRLNDTVSLLAGYLYGGNPVPDETFEPAIPDSNTHLFTIGTEIRGKAFTFGLSYGYQLLEGRRKNNSVDSNPDDGVIDPLRANGRYNSDLHMAGVSLTYRF
ncbi:MAG: outer membrane protein transport protein [Nitrospirota bacterium]|nr:outer membrane protein transport protein [Nitrospirota bacterium]